MDKPDASWFECKVKKIYLDSIIALSDEILAVKAQDSSIDTSHLEAQIDNLVYQLYNLNGNEIVL